MLPIRLNSVGAFSMNFITFAELAKSFALVDM